MNLATRTQPAGARNVDRTPSPGDLDPPRAPSGESRALMFLEVWGLVVLMVFVAAFFAIWPETSDTFLTLDNFQILVATQSVPAIIALGALVPLVLFKIDLSVGAAASLSAVFTAAWLSDGMALLLAVVLGIGLGVVVGAVNAFFVARKGLNEVITTLGIATVITGVVTQKTGGVALVSNIPEGLTNFGNGELLGVPNSFAVLVVIAGAVYYVLEHTPFGRQLYAYGDNKNAAELVGINTRRALAFAFLAAATLSAVAGVLYLSRAGGASPTVGEGFTLPAIAAAFLSAAAVRPGKYNVGGTLLAIFFLAIVNNGLNLAGAEPYITYYVNGGALVLGVGLAAVLQRRRTG